MYIGRKEGRWVGILQFCFLDGLGYAKSQIICRTIQDSPDGLETKYRQAGSRLEIRGLGEY